MKPVGFAVFAVLVLVAGVGAGCSSSSGGKGASPSSSARAGGWDAPTTFRFESLDRRQAPKVEAVFRSRNMLYRRTSDEPLAYEVTGLRDFNQVARLNKDLADATDQPFETASMTFGGLDPAASTYANIEVKVTPGAEAFVADGAQSGSTPWRRVFVDKTGVWKGLVNTKGMVKKQGGWLFVAATRDGLTRYSRINMATRQAESLSFTRVKDANLPAPGSRAGSETADASGGGGGGGGFKWPWE
ncbi:MAG: hypothetical protein ACKVZJ_03060 [Phycisphaerales bacterium]